MKFPCWFPLLHVGAISVVLTSLVNEAGGTLRYVHSVRESSTSTNHPFVGYNGSTSRSDFPQRNMTTGSSKQFVNVVEVAHKSLNESRTSTRQSYDLLEVSTTEGDRIHEKLKSVRNQSLPDGHVRDGPERHPYPKPMVTNGGADVDGGKSFNYMIPVAIAALALPLLGAAVFFSYTKVRDFWEKRHYRRMDFLIEGMYNE